MNGTTFQEWLFLQRDRRDPVGDLARDIAQDRADNCLRIVRSGQGLKRHIRKYHGDHTSGVLEAVDTAWEEYLESGSTAPEQPAPSFKMAPDLSGSFSPPVLVKARRAVEQGAVVVDPHARGVYAARSADGSKMYRVQVWNDSGEWAGTCTCDWGTRQGMRMVGCYHVAAAILLEAGP